MSWSGLRRLPGPRDGSGVRSPSSFSGRPALPSVLDDEHYFPLLLGGKNRLGRKDRLHKLFHHSPAKVRDFLHLFQNLIAVGFVGAEGFPEFDVSHFYLGPDFHISLLYLERDLTQPLHLRAFQAQVTSKSVAIKQSQQLLNPDAFPRLP